MIRQFRQLSRQVLGINRRNYDLIARYNPRVFFQIVDHKVKAKAALRAIGVPVVETLAVYRFHRELADFVHQSQGWPEFVIKPAQGAGGQGVMSIIESQGAQFITADGRALTSAAIESHLSDILSGIYSLNQRYDEALIERRIAPHAVLAHLSYRGLPDIRVIVFRGVPLMAMLRVATRASQGRANLHVGGIGVGIDLQTGITTQAIRGKTWIPVHPDTALPLAGVQLPCWQELLTITARCADAVELGYLGVDLTLDSTGAPLVLELNARPGLSIQLANRRGLRPLIEAVEQRAPHGLSVADRVAFGHEVVARIPSP